MSVYWWHLSLTFHHTPSPLLQNTSFRFRHLYNNNNNNNKDDNSNNKNNNNNINKENDNNDKNNNNNNNNNNGGTCQGDMDGHRHFLCLLSLFCSLPTVLTTKQTLKNNNLNKNKNNLNS